MTIDAFVAVAVRFVVPVTTDPKVTPDDGGSPGFLGFVWTFAIALALVGLILSMRRHLRTVDRNARLQGVSEDGDAGTPSTPEGTSEQVVAPTTTSSDAGSGEGGTSEQVVAQTTTSSDAGPGEGGTSEQVVAQTTTSSDAVEEGEGRVNHGRGPA